MQVQSENKTALYRMNLSSRQGGAVLHYTAVHVTILVWIIDSNAVAVSHGYDACFSVKACDGLYQLIKSIGMD